MSVSDLPQPSNEGRLWDAQDLEYLYRARMDKVPYAVIGAQLKRTAESCKGKWLRTDWENMPWFSPIAKDVKEQKKVAYENRLEGGFQSRLDLARLRADAIGDVLYKAIKKAPEIKQRLWSPPKNVQHKGSEEVGLLLSDLHIGHTHNEEETGGLSRYCIDIFRKRMRKLEKKVSDIYELHSMLYKIPTLHVFCLGDIVDGMNESGSWSPVYINTSIYDQFTIGFEEISRTLEYFLSIFKKVVFYGVRGNHGRVAKVGSEKDYANWDNLCYEMLKHKFANNGRLEFRLTKSWFLSARIKGHNFLLTHGDDLRKASSAVRSLESFAADMAGMTRVHPDFTLCGHFHQAAEQSTNFGKVIVNGSFVGGDVYSIKNLQKMTIPEQKIFGINDTHGITWRYDLDLT
jgi:predicted phosphodiesterase